MYFLATASRTPGTCAPTPTPCLPHQPPVLPLSTSYTEILPAESVALPLPGVTSASSSLNILFWKTELCCRSWEAIPSLESRRETCSSSDTAAMLLTCSFYFLLALLG